MKELIVKIEPVDGIHQRLRIGKESVGLFGKHDIKVALQASVRALRNAGYLVDDAEAQIELGRKKTS